MIAAPCSATALHKQGRCGCPLTPTTAGAYLKARDRDMKRWRRMPQAARVELINELTDQGWLVCGPDTWSPAEQVTWLANYTYPPERVKRAQDMHYRPVAQSWSQ